MEDLAAKRDKKNMTLTDMAKQLDIAVSTYHMYENGKRKIPTEVKNKICKILDIKPKEEKEIFLPSAFAVRKTKAG